MLDVLTHRGPDETGVADGDGWAMGAARLSLVGLDNGRQPFVSDNGRLVVVCNGEIYDHRRLRRELAARGHRFSTDSDCEIFLHLYEERGDAFVEGMNGQFAVAVLETRSRRLVLARDPAGIAPLFYTHDSDGVLFASEIKALLAVWRGARRLDPVALDQTLSLTGVIAPRTVVQGVRSVCPGEIVTIEPGTAPARRRYWRLPLPTAEERAEQWAALNSRPSSGEALDELEQKLLTATALRLDADREVGVYLSGGLDSSLIAALADQQDAFGGRSFGVSVRHGGLDESPFQELVADWLDLDHEFVPVTPTELVEYLPLAVRHAETPLKESFDSAAYLLARAVHQAGLRAVLGGQGADELFGGYVGFRFDAGGDAVRRTPPHSDEARIRWRLWGVEDFVYEKDQASYIGSKQALVRKDFLPDPTLAWAEYDPPVDHAMLAALHPFDRRTYVDFELRLGNHLLSDHGDRMAMASSVEVRYPFLDPAVIEAAVALHPLEKLVGLSEKVPLKQIAARRIPRRVVHREKFGFACPGSPQILQAGTSWVRELVAADTIRDQGIFEPDRVAELVEVNSRPGHTINVPMEEDELMVVITTGLLMAELGLSV